MKVVKHDVKVNHPAKELWRVWIKNVQATAPRLVPNHYHSIEYLDGPPLAPGGVIRINYVPQFGHFDHLTAVFEELDHETYSLRARIIEGGHLGKASVPHMVYAVKLIPGDTPNSCILKFNFEYDEKAGDKVDQLLKQEMSVYGASLNSHLSSSK